MKPTYLPTLQAPNPTPPSQPTSPNETEELPAPQPHILRTKYNSYRCTTCEYTLIRFNPHMGTDPSSTHHYFIPNSSCTHCGVELVLEYFSHDPMWKSNDCRFIDEKFCDICLSSLSVLPPQRKWPHVLWSLLAHALLVCPCFAVLPTPRSLALLEKLAAWTVPQVWPY